MEEQTPAQPEPRSPIAQREVVDRASWGIRQTHPNDRREDGAASPALPYVGG